MKISIFGLGYVGCVSLACLAHKGYFVIGVDSNQNKVKLVNLGRPTIIEKDIDNLMANAFKNQKIEATSDYRRAVTETEISIISVGTPSTNEGHLDLSYIYRVADEIGKALKDKDMFHIIVIRSTVMPGTNRKVGEIIEKSSLKIFNKHFAVVSNPEFLREGSAIKDYFNPPVTVLGSDNEYALDKIEELYQDLNGPIKRVSIEVAELIKYVNNSFHALKITFANEVGNICKNLGIDSHEVMDLFVMDKQLNLSPYYLKPGFAYGGSCLPKDLRGLKTIAHDHYLSSPVLESIENSNRVQKQIAIDLIEKQGKEKIGILGLSFKEHTDDLRYSPMVEIAEYFLGKGFKLQIFDKSISISKLTGTNREYIEKHIPHLSELISDDIVKIFKQSELIVISQKINGIVDLIETHKNIFFIDLIRVTDNHYDNYEGICW